MSDPKRPQRRPWFADPRLTNPGPGLKAVPASVLRSRNDKPVSITSPALEWAAIQAAAVTSPDGRSLYQWERKIIDDIFQNGVDAGRVRIVEARLLNFPTTLANQIRVAPGWTFEGNRTPILVHEMTHVWQYQTRGTSYITDSVCHNASGMIATGNRDVAYMNYHLQPNSSMGDFTAEEQATIVGDYYEITRVYQKNANPPKWVELRKPDLPIYEQLIAEVRSATPMSDTTVYQRSLMTMPVPGDPSRTQSFMPLFQVRF